jgi:hypothetical protein
LLFNVYRGADEAWGCSRGVGGATREVGLTRKGSRTPGIPLALPVAVGEAGLFDAAGGASSTSGRPHGLGCALWRARRTTECVGASSVPPVLPLVRLCLGSPTRHGQTHNHLPGPPQPLGADSLSSQAPPRIQLEAGPLPLSPLVLISAPAPLQHRQQEMGGTWWWTVGGRPRSHPPLPRRLLADPLPQPPDQPLPQRAATERRRRWLAPLAPLAAEPPPPTQGWTLPSPSAAPHARRATARRQSSRPAPARA